MENEESFRRSDAINYLLQARLGFATRHGMTALCMLVLLVLLSLYWVRVPDTLDGQFVLTGSNPPKGLVAKVNSRVAKLRVLDRQQVAEKQVLMELDNLAEPGKPAQLEKLLNAIHLSDADVGAWNIVFISGQALTGLGELQSLYETFKKANNELYMAVTDRQYQQQRGIVRNRVAYLERLYGNLKREEVIAHNDLRLAQESFNSDSTLFSKGSLSRLEFKNTESMRMQKQLALINIQQNLLSNESMRNDVGEQLLTIDRNLAQQKNNFVLAYHTLAAGLAEWKSKYLVTAPVKGQVVFNKNIYQGMNVAAGDELLYVMPGNGRMVCEMLIPQVNFGKLKQGQRAIVKFEGFNHEEFGVLNAFVYHISELPQEIRSQSGQVQNCYMVQLAFRNGLTTSYHKTIDPRFGLTGSASIVLDDRNLLSKLFLDKFRSLSER